MGDQLEHQTDALATALIVGNHPTAELAWHRRVAARGRAVLRRKPRAHDITAGEASDLIAAGRRGA